MYGNQTAVDDLSFTVPVGQTCGFLGPNGAGKSTAMKIMTGFLQPDEGEVFIHDVARSSQQMKAKESIGYLPEHNPMYKHMFVREFLRFVGKLHHKPISKQRINDVVEMVGLTKESNKLIGSLSKGYRQRVGLAQAILHDPDILILDEPLSGLDPNQLAEIRQLIINLGKEKTLLFSSHILQEVELVAERILLIKDGKLVHDSENEPLSASGYLFVQFEHRPNEALTQSLHNLAQCEIDGNVVKVFETSTETRKSLFYLASSSNNALLELREVKQNLTEVFQQKTQSL